MKGKEGLIALTNFKWSLSIRTDKVGSTCSVAILKPTLAIFLYYQQNKYYILYLLKTLPSGGQDFGRTLGQRMYRVIPFPLTV